MAIAILTAGFGAALPRSPQRGPAIRYSKSRLLCRRLAQRHRADFQPRDPSGCDRLARRANQPRIYLFGRVVQPFV
jgi:hypothetical protein